jgi:2-oxoglutarate ferredoxin oxidoreductase subunit beta
MCPTQWKVLPAEAPQWMQEKMLPYYPLGSFGTIKGP